MSKVEEVWAYVYEEADGNEGIPAFLLEGPQIWMPMIGADRTRVESLRPYAQKIANSTGKQLTLVRFGFRQEMEVIAPEDGSTN